MAVQGGRVVLYGNEAIARGAFEAGVLLATGYPGTPSTEIIEAMASYREVDVSWSPNEKVALEVAIGAAIGGGRAMACMKHVGVNVAADPLMTVVNTGVNAGLVLVSADDPGMHSSQNEQDSRWWGRFGRMPILEPADSAEALAFTALAFELSEQFDTPVLLRTSTRISHARSPVTLHPRRDVPLRDYQPDRAKYVIVPANARQLKPKVLRREQLLAEYAETSPLNRAEWPQGEPEGRAERGFVTGGMAYNYVREAYPDAPVFKVGISYPLPQAALRAFAAKVKQLYVVEELDPFWEIELRNMGLDPIGKAAFPAAGELSMALVRAGVTGEAAAPAAPAAAAASGDKAASSPGAALPGRPPVLCPGCPHRGVFHVLRRLRLIVTGDIGCYTLGVMPPFEAMDTCICMGASIGTAIGMRRVMPPEQAAKVVAVIGDSTFIHSGITPLIDAVYNRTDITVLILDNSTTAMTGHQGHPASGRTARGEAGGQVSLEAIVEASGVRRSWIVDSLDPKAVESAVRQALQPGDGPAVVIARRQCALIDPALRGRHPVTYDPTSCIECGACLRLGCPALARAGKRPDVQAALCVGCDLCVRVCPKGALRSSRGGDQA